MGLSRLENFLRSFRGNIIYVDPNALDSTDSIENDGTSAARPLKTIQRALIEAARFSYLPGLNNDKFANTTILIYPGEHLIDNRPGWIPEVDPLNQNKASYRLRSNQTSTDFPAFDASTNFDITSDTNALYKLNSVHGGVIVPRGTSIVGMDLRKTKIRPKYIPDPVDDTVERSAIFRLTGSCYLWQFSIFDGNQNGQVFYNYGQGKTVPNFSHNKLTVFEYADGVNNVEIDDVYIKKSYVSTDLDMYYQKIGLAYGPPARQIKNDYPSPNIDIQTKLDEFRIVGSRGFEVNIANIFCGDNITPSTVATVVLESPISELDVDSAIRIDGVGVSEFNGQFVVKSIIDPVTIEYNLSAAPPTAQGGTSGTLNLVVDTVSSASPYIFNCSLRSVYGMCGLHADGSKADGFKSMVVAQYTGISLQKDNNAFVKYNQETASYNSINVENIATDSLARYKPEYQNYHIKASNNAFIQCVSVFAIGFSQHFLSESGGDQSITNSNSNFGAIALSASGYQDSAFLRDDAGYITHIIPPKEIGGESISVECDQIDISLTNFVVNPSSPDKLYFYNRNDPFDPPKSVVDGYRIGAKINDKLNVIISEVQYSSDIIMQPNPSYTGAQVSYQKTSPVQRNGSVNTIAQDPVNIITLDSQHNFINGESVRVISKNGNLPEGILPEQIYYIITDSVDPSLTNSTIKLASTLNDALNKIAITIYNTSSSELTIVSRVSDKKSGDIGHPIQFDSVRNQWYINVNPLQNNIYTAIQSSSEISTARTFLTRILSNRVSEDSIYKLRYVIPKDSTFRARPPSEGYVIQESSTTITGEDEIPTQFSIDQPLSNSTQLRNLRLISDASWSSNIATINTEIPHNLSVGSKVQIVNIFSSSNTTGVGNSGFNGIFDVTSLPSSKSFRYSLSTNPGIFVDTTSIRSKSSPHYIRKNLPGTYLVYRSDKIQEYIENKQDGVYHLIVTNSSNSPDVEPFTDYKFSQPIQNLYPQVDRDNLKSDPNASICYASPSTIGQVLINDPENSITKETLNDCFKDYRINFGLNDIRSSTGIAHSIFTNIDHGLNPVTALTVVSGGSNYGYGDGIPDQTLYNANLLPTNSKGEGATAVIKITSSGSISDIKIMDGGSNYAVDDVLTVVGVATTTGWVPATVRVDSIYNHIGETLQITGTDDDSYNQLYNITGITSSRVLEVDSSFEISSPSAILGFSRVSNSNVSLTGNSFLATHTASGDVTTFTTSGGRSHGLQVGDKVTFRRTDNENLGNYIVRTVVSLTSFTIGSNIGNSTSRVFPYKYSSTGGLISRSTESESSRLVANYAGITTTLSDLIEANDPEIYIPNLLNTGIKIGDYLEIDNEIVKVRENVVGGITPLIVFRGVLGTKQDSHESGTIIRKISPIPIELRRNSILRASGHTFEYLGYGSGNYSTAFPDRQDRQLSIQEELLSQSFKSDGGSSIFTGMNSNGDFYVGNKRVSSATGREQVFDSPIPTSRGEEISNETSLDVTSTSELYVSRRIRVDGGQENNIISEFGGPTIFNEKVTVNNDIESNSLYLQGDLSISNKYTVSYQEPTIIGTPGDITYYSNPTQDGGYVGWTYTIENQWREFGPIQNQLGRYVGIWSGRIIPSTGTGNNGIFWDSNPGGGSGDVAFIKYYAQNGENTRLHIGIGNESNDDIYLDATETITSGNATITGDLTVSGTTTIEGVLVVNTVSGDTTIDGLLTVNSEDGINSTKFVKVGAAATHFLKANGDDALLAGQEVIDAIGYIPANIANVTGDLPVGNSKICDPFPNIPDTSSPFNGILVDFPLTINNEPYISAGGAANLIVSLGGVIQKPGNDFIIVQDPIANDNTSNIRFTTPPPVGVNHFIVALGGQGSLLNNVDWDNKGQIVVAYTNNFADTVDVSGTNGSILTEDSTATTGVSWKNNINVSGSITGGAITGTSLNVGSGQITGDLSITNITGLGGDIYVNGGTDGIFVFHNTTNNGTIHLSAKNNFGTYNTVLVASNSSVQVNGELNVTGEVTAWASDIRLKTNIEPIENALDKVLALNGFTYNFNDIGKELGFDASIRHAGVSAQEVQAVLPEVVAPAPVSDEYITVKYEKIIPLLIEAIKELKAEVEELKGGK
jgi:hypothetical protein